MRRGIATRLVSGLALCASALTAPVVVPGLATGAAAATPTSVVVAAAGDIACDPADSNFSGSNTSTCQMRATANRIVAMKPSYVLPIGDTQYVKTTTQGVEPTITQYQQGYGATWGQLASRLPGVVVRPVAGNHEYGDLAENGKAPLTAASNYFKYFGPSGLNLLPSTVTSPSSAWYSYDIPVGNSSWHVVALDGECYAVPSGGTASGCAAGSPQEKWLANDLSAHVGGCILAYIHEPRWAWGDEDDPRYAAIWSDLVRYRTTAMLSGHDHVYERFAPMDVNGNPSTYGVAQFIVGTGGHSLEPLDTSMPKQPALRAVDAAHFGALKLTLQQSSMMFDYQTTSGASSDSGTLACTPSPPSSAPTVTAVTPTSGPSAGGTTLHVSGTGFTSGATVTVAGVAATNVTVASASSLTAVAPAGLTTGDVAVTTSSGTSPPSVDDQFTHAFSTSGYSISLAASATRPKTGSSVTLTATANRDLGPTPYFFSIVDTTTGIPLVQSGSGSVLTTTVSQSAAMTKRYVAQIDIHGHAPLQAVSAPQVVSWTVPAPNAPTVTAITPANGPASGGTAVTVTGTGFTSGATVAFGGAAATNVSVASPTSLTATAPVMPAGGPAAVDVTVTTASGTSDPSSADVFTYAFASNGYDVSLAATTTQAYVGGATTLTATANQDVGPTPYGISIVDATTGKVVAHTGWGSFVRVTVSQSQPTAHRYFAQIDKSSGPPVQAASAPTAVTWAGTAPAGSAPAVTGVSPGSGASAGWDVVTLTGTGFTPDAWVSLGGSPAEYVTVNSPTSLSATIPPGSSTQHAIVSTAAGSSTPNVADEYTYTFSSNGYAISLAASANAAAVGGSVTLTATANQDMGPTPYTYSIIDATTGAVVAHSGSGSVITVTLSATQPITRRFVAQIDNDSTGSGPLQAVSSPTVVSWS